jgi:tetratricopeptide (TPR) repeat protein
VSVLPKLQEIVSALKAGDSDQALDLAHAAVRAGLEHPFLFRLTGFALERQGAWEEAAVFLRRALAASPGDPDLLTVIGGCQARLGRPVEAMGAYRQAIASDPGAVEAHHGLAECLAVVGAAEESRAAYERVLALKPDHLEARAALALLTARLGESAVARRHAEAALMLDPAHAVAGTALACAAVAERSFAEAEARLQGLAARSDLGDTVRGAALSLLGDALDGQDRPEEALEAYDAAARAMARAYGPRYADAAEVFAERMKLLPDWLAATEASSWAEAPAAASDPAGPRVHVFLVGFPRSGTTLLEQVLAAHPQVLSLEEQPTLAEAETAFLSSAEGVRTLAGLDGATAAHHRARYWRRVRALGVEPAGKVFIDKLPLNAVNLPLVAKLFPEARVLLALRDPRDVVLSCFRRAFSLNAATYGMLTLEGAAGLYDSVMAVVEASRARLPLRLREIRHEALVEDFETEARALCAFLDLPWDEDLHAFAEKARGRTITTPSAAQVRRGLYRTGLEQWRRYAGALAGVRDRLDPWVETWGYPKD